MQDDKNNKKRSKYKTITQQVRQQLIKRVQQGQNIKDISTQMNLNISTCKAIIKVYHQQGRVGKKKKRNKVINVIQTFSFYSMDGMKLQQIAPLKIQQSKIKAAKCQDLDKTLTQKSTERAQQLLKQTIETKKKVQQVMMQQQFLQNLNGLNLGNINSLGNIGGMNNINSMGNLGNMNNLDFNMNMGLGMNMNMNMIPNINGGIMGFNNNNNNQSISNIIGNFQQFLNQQQQHPQKLQYLEQPEPLNNNNNNINNNINNNGVCFPPSLNSINHQSQSLPQPQGQPQEQNNQNQGQNNQSNNNSSQIAENIQNNISNNGSHTHYSDDQNNKGGNGQNRGFHKFPPNTF